jgi:hypothetical protein
MINDHRIRESESWLPVFYIGNGRKTKWIEIISARLYTE